MNLSFCFIKCHYKHVWTLLFDAHFANFVLLVFKLAVFCCIWWFNNYLNACLSLDFILSYGVLVFNGFFYIIAAMVRHSRWIGHIQVTRGRIRLVSLGFPSSSCPLFCSLLSALCKHLICFPLMYFYNHQDTSIYLLVIWVQRLLMQLCLPASRSILVVREFLIALNIFYWFFLSWVWSTRVKFSWFPDAYNQYSCL